MCTFRQVGGEFRLTTTVSSPGAVRLIDRFVFFLALLSLCLQRSKYSGFDLDVELPMESESRETGKGGLVSNEWRIFQAPQPWNSRRRSLLCKLFLCLFHLLWKYADALNLQVFFVPALARSSY